MVFVMTKLPAGHTTLTPGPLAHALEYAACTAEVASVTPSPMAPLTVTKARLLSAVMNEVLSFGPNAMPLMRRAAVAAIEDSAARMTNVGHSTRVRLTKNSRR